MATHDGRATSDETLAQVHKRVLAGGAERYHAANAAKGKLFARERVALLVDEGTFVEDGLYANSMADGLPADASASLTGSPIQAGDTLTWLRTILPVGSRHSGSAPSGSTLRSLWSAVHRTVATVGMPSRW